ncbi:ABC transporter ATP-binding protein [Aneurinibacillus sp. REN35]|uniref:ABC transporter ATP-binding protein n=1 Tax=Aneurinibacillus sp. REN35 TaxID=3237286 RepID=UPI003529964C
MTETILEVEDLTCRFHTPKGIVEAVGGVSFRVHRGEIMALVGESGCGKSVTSQAIMRLIGDRKHEEIGGSVRFKGANLLELSEAEMQILRGDRIAMILQDPMTSLNPAYRIGEQVAEVPRIHQKKDKKEAWSIAVEMLRSVKIPAPEERARDYPHQFSGGMRQRSIIGMALASKPDLLIADEPTTALDVTIQAQILDLIQDMRKKTGAAVVLITHDLGVVAEVCDSVAVMYAGRIVEQAPVRELFASPRHPYTKGLLASLPKPGSRERLKPIAGQPPNLHDLPSGCVFAPRCPHAESVCTTKMPPLEETKATHRVACWLEERINHDQ